MYKIFFKDRPVGHAEVKKEGLYYRFSCTCTPPDREIYRVSVTDGKNRRNLGICVPEGTQFTLTARVPCKNLNEDKLSFSLIGKDIEEPVLPIATGEPFEYLDQLETARLQITNGQPEIMIDPIQDQQDSDQSQGPLNKSVLQ